MSIRAAFTNVSWKATILVAVGVMILYAPNVLSEDVGIDFITLLIVCPLSATISFILIISAFVMRKTKMAAGLLVSGITIIFVSFIMFLLVPYYASGLIFTIKDRYYWSQGKERYKEAFESQPAIPHDLNHVPFRLWGFVGGTQVWLVFDPSDHLDASIGHDGFVPNIPCPVWRTEKLSPNYYAVYQDAELFWDRCTDDGQPGPVARIP